MELLKYHYYHIDLGICEIHDAMFVGYLDDSPIKKAVFNLSRMHATNSVKIIIPVDELDACEV